MKKNDDVVRLRNDVKHDIEIILNKINRQDRDIHNLKMALETIVASVQEEEVIVEGYA